MRLHTSGQHSRHVHARTSRDCLTASQHVMSRHVLRHPSSCTASRWSSNYVCMAAKNSSEGCRRDSICSISMAFAALGCDQHMCTLHWIDKTNLATNIGGCRGFGPGQQCLLQTHLESEQPAIYQIHQKRNSYMVRSMPSACEPGCHTSRNWLFRF